MRPLWMEFPHDFTSFSIDTNYMFGDSFFIAATYPSLFEAQAYLPPSDDWYNFFTSQLVTPSHNPQTFQVENEELAVFVKAGSIVPRKYLRRLSALQTLNDNYLIDVYPCVKGEKTSQASGYLYLDDGETFNHQHSDNFTLVEIKYEDNKLSIDVQNSKYTSGQSFIIDEINIFGIDFAPLRIKPLINGIITSDKELKFKYDETAKQVVITGVHIHIIDHANKGHPILKVYFEDVEDQSTLSEF